MPKPAKPAEEAKPAKVICSRSLVCSRGILNAGDECKKEYIKGGEKVFNELLKKGLLKYES